MSSRRSATLRGWHADGGRYQFAEALAAAVLRRGHQYPVGEERDAVLDVYRDRPVPGDDRPAVGQLHGVRRAEREHRLDGERHARYQARTLARPALVEHVRVLVHLGTDALPPVPAT